MASITITSNISDMDEGSAAAYAVCFQDSEFTDVANVDSTGRAAVIRYVMDHKNFGDGPVVPMTAAAGSQHEFSATLTKELANVDTSPGDAISIDFGVTNHHAYVVTQSGKFKNAFHVKHVPVTIVESFGLSDGLMKNVVYKFDKQNVYIANSLITNNSVYSSRFYLSDTQVADTSSLTMNLYSRLGYRKNGDETVYSLTHNNYDYINTTTTPTISVLQGYDGNHTSNLINNPEIPLLRTRGITTGWISYNPGKFFLDIDLGAVYDLSKLKIHTAISNFQLDKATVYVSEQNDFGSLPNTNTHTSLSSTYWDYYGTPSMDDLTINNSLYIGEVKYDGVTRLPVYNLVINNINGRYVRIYFLGQSYLELYGIQIDGTLHNASNSLGYRNIQIPSSTTIAIDETKYLYIDHYDVSNTQIDTSVFDLVLSEPYIAHYILTQNDDTYHSYTNTVTITADGQYGTSTYPTNLINKSIDNSYWMSTIASSSFINSTGLLQIDLGGVYDLTNIIIVSNPGGYKLIDSYIFASVDNQFGSLPTVNADINTFWGINGETYDGPTAENTTGQSTYVTRIVNEEPDIRYEPTYSFSKFEKEIGVSARYIRIYTISDQWVVQLHGVQIYGKPSS